MKHTYFIFLILIAPSFVHSSEFDSQNNLKTLFTSPDTRTHLNQLRNSGKFDRQSQQTPGVIFRKPLQVKMQGVVIRNNQKPVIFVNDSNTLKSTTVDNQIHIKDSKLKTNTLSVPVRVNQQSISLKPGQQWRESDNNAKDNYQIKAPKEKPEGLTEQVISRTIN